MVRRTPQYAIHHVVPSITRHIAANARSTRRRVPHGKRARGAVSQEESPFTPPEDWYEPLEQRPTNPHQYKIIEQAPGKGYRHILSPQEIRDRLRMLPPSFVQPLDTVQLSRMTRKKESFACYGMQWGSSLYLYPMEESLEEWHGQPPTPNQVNEVEMYGGRWTQEAADLWRLKWTEKAIRDFYLNNILIHELGHLLDERNNSYVDRERYAEWFAIEYGFRRTTRLEPAARRGTPTVRHGKK